MNAELTKELLDSLIQCLDHADKLNKIDAEFGCVDGTIIGTGRADYTQGSTLYNLKIDSKKFALIDIPGIEGDESKYESTIKTSLEQAHVIFYVNGSGKKPEKDSLDKIKKYMHDGTSVYAVFNTHCKAKKNRVLGLDKTYTEELEDAYSKQQEVILQTEEQFRSFLGQNFKGSISINGLLAFCALALNKNRSTIKDEDEKNLRNDQKKFLNEYAGDENSMISDSHVKIIESIIEEKVDHFDVYIAEENLKKLRNRMREMTEKIDSLRQYETNKINGFISIYTEFQDNIRNAKDDFISEIRHINRGAVSEIFDDLLMELFKQVERDDGKPDADAVQRIVAEKKDDIIHKIQNGVNQKLDRAKNDFYRSLEDAQDRLQKDLVRQQVQFQVELSSDSVAIGNDFEKALKLNLGDYGKYLGSIGGLALSGLAIGSLFPGIGNIIGACVGAVLGVLSGIWNIFVSKKKRIENAKSQIKRAIDEQIDNISDQLKQEIKNLQYEEKIEAVYGEIFENIEEQKKSLIKIKYILNLVNDELQGKYRGLT